MKLSVDVHAGLISGIKKIEIGAKNSVIKVHASAPGGGTLESQVDPADSKMCCISDSQALKLGQIGLAASHYSVYTALAAECFSVH